jgi:uroporphyrinogen decarboxylase
MGYEHFSTTLADDLDLVAEVSARVGQIQFAVMRRVVKMPGVVAAWYGDDLAYTESLLVSPKVLRKYFFPWIEELAGIAHAAGFPFIMHSDGRLWQVLDDLIALGVNDLQPIEPKAMDIYDVKEKVGDRLCLFGGVDLDRLCRATPDEIRTLARRLIHDIGSRSGYAVGSSNSIPRYVPFENYMALREASLNPRG